MKMGVRMSQSLGEVTVALALAFMVAFVVFLAWFMAVCIPMSFALAFLIFPALIVLAVARIDEPLFGLMMPASCNCQLLPLA